MCDILMVLFETLNFLLMNPFVTVCKKMPIN